MSDKPDGGPAFPQELVTGFEARGSVGGISVKSEWIRGMSLRDYFAGQALIAMVRQYDFQDARGNEREGAARCYEWADAMIAERAKVDA